MTDWDCLKENCLENKKIEKSRKTNDWILRVGTGYPGPLFKKTNAGEGNEKTAGRRKLRKSFKREVDLRLGTNC